MLIQKPRHKSWNKLSNSGIHRWKTSVCACTMIESGCTPCCLNADSAFKQGYVTFSAVNQRCIVSGLLCKVK